MGAKGGVGGGVVVGKEVRVGVGAVRAAGFGVEVGVEDVHATTKVDMSATESRRTDFNAFIHSFLSSEIFLTRRTKSRSSVNNRRSVSTPETCSR